MLIYCSLVTFYRSLGKRSIENVVFKFLYYMIKYVFEAMRMNEINIEQMEYLFLRRKRSSAVSERQKNLLFKAAQRHWEEEFVGKAKDATKAEAAFARKDKDGDGKLTEEEFLARGKKKGQ